MVMAVGLAVGGDRNQLPLGQRCRSRQRSTHPLVSVTHQRPEGDIVRHRAVVHEERNGFPAGAAVQTRRAGSGSAGYLVWCQDREANAFACENLERLLIHRRFRQPHPLRFPAEPAAEIGDAPAHLGHLLPLGTERENRVVIGHRYGITVTQPCDTVTVGRQHRRIGCWRLPFHPLEKGRAEVEADLFEGVDDAEDPAFVPGDSGRGHGAVALLLYSLIPVVEGSG